MPGRALRPHALAQAAALALCGGLAAGAAQAQTTIEVTGIRASLEKSIATKRDAATNIEVVTAEDVGKMPDKNIADALSRLAGVNVQFGGALAMDEAERIAIRGSSPNLNLVTIAGHALSSGDWHVGDQGSSGRSVGFGLMPSQLIGQAIVYKSSQADITEGGIAGTVDIRLRKPLDFRKTLTGEASVGFVHATLPNKTDPQVSGLVGWKNASSTFGVLVQAFKEDRHLRRDGQETFSFATVAANAAAVTGVPANATTGLTTAIPGNAALAGKRLPGSLNSALFEGVRERTGGYIGVQFKPSAKVDLSFSAFHSVLKADNYNSSAFALPGTLINQGANGWLVQNPVIEGDVIVSATLVRNPSAAAANQNLRLIGFQFDHNVREGAESLSSFYDLEGKFKITDSISVDGRIGYTKGSGVTNSQPSLTFGLINPNMRYQINTTRPTDYAMLNPAGQPINLATTASYSQMSNTGASVESNDDEKYLHLDGSWAPSAGWLTKVKTGLRVAEHHRTYDVLGARWNAQDGPNGPLSVSPFVSVTGGLLVTNIVQPGDLPTPATAYPSNWGSGLNADFPRQLFRFSPEQIQAFANKYVNWHPTRNKIYTSGYDVKEKNEALYLMGEYEIGRVTGNFGLRYVTTKVSSLAYQALPTTGAGSCAVIQPCAVPGAIVGSYFASYLPQLVETTHKATLPSVNLRWEVQRGLIVRAAANKSLGRPNYNELAAAVSLNNTLLTGSSGNPNLKPITANNAEASVAWYHARRAYVSAGVFYSDLKDYVKAGTSLVEFFNTSTGTNSIYTVTSRIGVKARVKGAELAMEQPIGAGFGVISNFTYVDGRDQDNVELLGTSRKTANLIGYYEDDRFSARVAVNYRSDYAIGFVGNGTNTAGNGVHRYNGSYGVSASASWRINDRFSINLDGNNLTDPVRSTYFITTNAPGYWHQSGRQFFLSLRGKV